MTRDEIIVILKEERTKWQNTRVEKGQDRTLWEWQADALLAAQSDEATIANLKARGVLVPYSRTHNAPPDAYEVVLPGPAMEDEQ